MLEVMGSMIFESCGMGGGRDKSDIWRVLKYRESYCMDMSGSIHHCSSAEVLTVVGREVLSVTRSGSTI